jgi:tetratricopeptide (TPR) repeat protein/type II secretory pathway predicted ATPase ExeA
LRLLLSRWERACDGEGQLVLVAGEAGIGKSRLVAEFHDRIRDIPHIWMEVAAEQFFENTPLHAIVEMLSQWLELQDAVTTEEQFKRVERALASAGLSIGEAVPLVAELLQLPPIERYPASPLTSEQKRKRLLPALSGWVLGAAKVQPMVMVVEDLHWLDPSTLELLHLLAEQGVTVPLMLLYTTRPEFHTPWPMRSHHSQITLNPLSARDVREMVALVAARNALANESVEAVVERTGGVPLFVEELTRAVLENGRQRESGREIPATLHDSLMARLDRLGAAKEVIQIGAVIGGEFSYELLHAIHPLPDHDLQSAIRIATDAELVYVRGLPPEASYQFKHALIRDAAYEALLKSRRKELHRLVARTIEEQFPVIKEAHPEVLARHWTEAGASEKAIAEWSRAGQSFELGNAFKEALESYQRSVGLLNQLPETTERDLRELELRQSIVRTLQLIKGFSALETIQATERVAALAERAGNLKHLVQLMVLKFTGAFTSGELAAATAIGEQMLELAIREGSPTNFALARTTNIGTCYLRGDLDGAEKHFTLGATVFSDPGFRQFPGLAVLAVGFASFNAWMLGHADLSQQRELQMMTTANRENPFDLALSDWVAGCLSIYMREYERAESIATRSLAFAEQYRFSNRSAWSRYLLGYAKAQTGHVSDGIELIRQGIAGLLAGGARVGIVYCISLLAAAQELDGSTVHALETVEQALQANPDELIYRPEALRIRGELRNKQGQIELAETDLRDAVALAQKMGANMWQLRATMSLARLLAKRGRRDEARAILAEIHSWFTEGFDTADLKDAGALLEELGGSGARPALVQS